MRFIKITATRRGKRFMKMAEFTPITTQEEFDAAIKGRLERERSKYADYDDLKKSASESSTRIADLTAEITKLKSAAEAHKKEIEDRDGKIKAYETRSVKTRIAREAGLGWDAVDFLTGDDEDSIKASADALKSLIGSHNKAPSFKPDEGVSTSSTSRAELAKIAASIGKS